MQSNSTRLFVWLEDQNSLANILPNMIHGQMYMYSTSTLFDQETQNGQQDPAFTCDLRVTIRDRSLEAASCHNLSDHARQCCVMALPEVGAHTRS